MSSYVGMFNLQNLDEIEMLVFKIRSVFFLIQAEDWTNFLKRCPPRKAVRRFRKIKTRELFFSLMSNNRQLSSYF